MIWKKISAIIGALLLIAAFAGLVVGFENRYAKEVIVVETLRDFQVEQQQRSETFELKSDYRFYKFLYDDLTKDLNFYRKLLKENPDDLLIKEEYEEIIQQRRELKKKMDQILEKIK